MFSLVASPLLFMRAHVCILAFSGTQVHFKLTGKNPLEKEMVEEIAKTKVEEKTGAASCCDEHVINNQWSYLLQSSLRCAVQLQSCPGSLSVYCRKRPSSVRPSMWTSRSRECLGSSLQGTCLQPV